MGRHAFVAASVGIAGCSLFTDLGGFDEAPTTVLVPDGSSAGDSDTPSNDGSTGADVAVDAGVDSAPITAKYARSLTVTNTAEPTIAAGNAACTVLASDVVSAAVTNGKMRADLADLRIHGPSGNEVSRTADLLPQGRAYVCFTLEQAIAKNGAATYEMRHGDPNATPAPAGGVFPFVDDFDVVPSGPKWSTRGTPSVVNGRLKLPAGAVTAIATAPGADGVPTNASMVVSMQVVNPTSNALAKDAGNAEDYFFWWVGFQRFGDFAEGEPWMVFIGREVGGIRAENKQNTSGGGPCATPCSDVTYGLTDATRIYRIDRHEGGVVFTYDDGKTFAPLGASGDLAIMIRNSLATSDIFVDWVRARPIVWPEPTVAVGAEKAL